MRRQLSSSHVPAQRPGRNYPQSMERHIMPKLIEIDGKFFRMRRKKLVAIPEEWLGKVTFAQTMRERPSKMGRKVAKDIKSKFNKHYNERKEADEGSEGKGW
jgi:hypothetical protein